MRLIKPFDAAPKRGPRLPAAKPQWMREWIEDQGRWALFSCGHRANINARGMIVIAAFGGRKEVTVYCDRCDDFRTVTRFMKFLEYAGIKKTAVPEIPLF